MIVNRLLIAVLALSAMVPPLAGKENHQIQPISTRYAQTSSKVTLDATVRYFEDIQLQEARHFDGFGFDLDLTAPIRGGWQVRIIAPIYTEGEAKVIDTGRKTDIKGYGGVFDFPRILLEHQFLYQDRHGWNAGWFIGAGTKQNHLDTSHGDRINHQGLIGHLGLKADRFFNDGDVRLLGNLGMRGYFRSDDLNPSGGGDRFFLVDAHTASVFRLHERVWPGLELKYQGDFARYNSVSLMPQMIIPVASFLEVKLGVPFRLTHQGERIGARFQLTARF
jgi:hypothetical protein